MDFQEKIYSELNEATELLNQMKNLEEGEVVLFNELLAKIREIVEAKKLNYDEFLKDHIYFFMDIACNVNDDDFVNKYFSFIDSPFDFYRQTNRFNYYDSFADEFFAEPIMQERNEAEGFAEFGCEGFSSEDVKDLVFAYYTGYLVDEFGESSFINDQIVCMDDDFEKIILEKMLEDEFGDPDDMVDYLNDNEDEIPDSFKNLGVSLEEGVIKFSSVDRIRNPNDIFDFCETLDFDMKFKCTDIRCDDEGVYYIQYKFDNEFELEFIDALLKHFKKVGKLNISYNPKEY